VLEKTAEWIGAQSGWLGTAALALIGLGVTVLIATFVGFLRGRVGAAAAMGSLLDVSVDDPLPQATAAGPTGGPHRRAAAQPELQQFTETMARRLDAIEHHLEVLALRLPHAAAGAVPRAAGSGRSAQVSLEAAALRQAAGRH
jgi:hypothetical protein